MRKGATSGTVEKQTKRGQRLNMIPLLKICPVLSPGLSSLFPARASQIALMRMTLIPKLPNPEACELFGCPVLMDVSLQQL